MPGPQQSPEHLSVRQQHVEARHVWSVALATAGIHEIPNLSPAACLVFHSLVV